MRWLDGITDSDMSLSELRAKIGSVHSNAIQRRASLWPEPWSVVVALAGRFVMGKDRER